LKPHLFLLAIGAVLLLGAGPAWAAPVDFLGSDHHGDYSRDGGDKDSYHYSSSSGHHEDDWSGYGDDKDKKSSSDYGIGNYDKDDKDYSWNNGGSHDDDGDYKGKKYFPPEYGVYHADYDRHGDTDKDDDHHYYASICDKDDKGGRRHHPHDPDCDHPLPLPGALPLFGAGLTALGLMRRTRRQQSLAS